MSPSILVRRLFWGVGLLVNLKSVKPGRTHRFASQKKTVS